MTTENHKKHAIILDGPIGVGKTTFGRLLADRLAGQFLDGDRFSDPHGPWYASSLSTNRGIFTASMTAFDATSTVVIAYPMRCLNWIFLRRRFQAAQIETHCVGLQASLENITGQDRSRRLSVSEIARAQHMIEQGYGARPFNTFSFRTDTGDITTVLDGAVARLGSVLADGP
ncbi:hypothetical protein [Pseudoruegeria sp. SK021]|uniref:hypothetical protein n=1 Tax=Pseudoruegeria sp. SK021 TaxID=1933035 RepID=UPI000A223269|nr:hypothetical protein [Pseudoruegeria sp. SK021]OSP55685.1 hypothetical protein BV911_06130 [Pseudoruegeria sp. SK021]